MSINKRPDFFIVGAPKAGTTSLYAYLSMHPEVFMPATIKEPDYFSHKAILAQNLYYNTTHITSKEDYLALFSGANGANAIGEASVSYLFYPEAAHNIHQFNPEAKIIIILREPVERAYSHYLMDERLGLIKSRFEDIVFRKLDHNFADMYFQQIVSLGEYGEQVARYLSLFGNQQVKILFFDHLKADPGKVMKEIFTFLEVNADYPIDLGQKHNAYASPRNILVKKAYQMHHLRSRISQLIPETFKKRIRDTLFKEDKKPEISVEARQYLKEYYKKDVEMIRQITHSKCWE